MDSINKVQVKIQGINEIKAKTYRFKNKVINWFIRCKLVNYIFKVYVIRDSVLDLFKNKIKNYILKRDFLKIAFQENLILCFRDRIFDEVKFKSILKAKEHLFPLKSSFNVRITCSYDRILKNLACN